MTPTKQSWAQRERAKNWVFVGEIVAVAATVIALGIATWGLWEQVRVNKKTLQEIEQTRAFREGVERDVAAETLKEIENAALARSWTLLTTRAPGNSGKKQAMEYLASKRQPLNGIDLSCEAMGGIENNEQGEVACVRRPYLRRLDLSETTHGWRVSLWDANLSGADLYKANLSNADLWNANLSGANLWEADLSGARLNDADLLGARLWNANLSGANLYEANLSDAELWDANLSGASLGEADLSGASLYEANLSDAELWDANLSGASLLDTNLSSAHLSGTEFKDAKNIGSADFTDAWAWADRPPRNLPSNIYDAIDLCVLQDSLNIPSRRPDPCIKPSE